MLIHDKIKEIQKIKDEVTNVASTLKSDLDLKITQSIESCLDKAKKELSGKNEDSLNAAFSNFKTELKKDLTKENKELFDKNLDVLIKAILSSLDKQSLVNGACELLKKNEYFEGMIQNALLTSLRDVRDGSELMITQTRDEVINRMTSINLEQNIKEAIASYLEKNKEEIIKIQDFSFFKDMMLGDTRVIEQIQLYATYAVADALSKGDLQDIVASALSTKALDIFSESLELYEVRKKSFLASLALADIQQLGMIKIAHMALENLTIQALLEQREEVYKNILSMDENNIKSKTYAVI